MRTTSENLIADLIELTKDNMNRVERLKALSTEELNYRNSPGSWSILECIEHLNRYGDFYIPEIEKRLLDNNTKTSTYYKPGLLGDYFAKTMLPGEKLNKMKTFKSMNPIGSNLDRKTLDRFLNQQKQMLYLLNKARKVNLEKTKTSISISKWIRLKLGDTLRVVIYHNQRHVKQAWEVKSLDVRFET